MQRSFEELKSLYAHAMSTQNWNDVAVYTTEMLILEANHAWIWNSRGVALQRMGHPLDAILNYDKSLSIENAPNPYNNKGSALQELGKLDEALECFDKSLDMDPDIAQTHMNVGHIYKWTRKNELALHSYRKCVLLDPNYADGHMALGMMLLKMGHLQEGWREFEWRWKSGQLPPRGLKQPKWKGEDLTGKSILVYAEQGLGDIIQFGRYLGILAQRFPKCKVIAEVRQPVKRLIETIPELYAAINYGEKVPPVDYVISMMSLGALFTPSISSIPSNQRYFLRLTDIETWENRFSILPDDVRVGICWAGMSRIDNPVAAKIDEIRSASLEQLQKLGQVKDVMWISLQKGPPAVQIKQTGLKIADFTEDMYDFYETCCAIENCDLVISVDTAVAHAAASIGKPTWLLSRWDGCWRWFGEREDSPWYPSMRQFVQPNPGDWGGMVDKVVEELAEFVRSKNLPE